ncbi:undecaprenyl-diphosphate phosphatase [Amorphus sp. 3PC139-8]
MEADTIINAVILGFVEGLTEFIPVSSTGHLLLLGHFLGFESKGKTFEVLIQLGAILAILSVYFGRLWHMVIAFPTDPNARRFLIGIVVAFLPAAFAGVLLHDFIKTVLFESPTLICVTLIVGGVILLVLDRMPLRPRYTNAYTYPVWLALAIGCFQCLALVPGVSRSGATIGGALVLGTDKRSAAEFSFFLALPTMAGAFTYDLYKNRDLISMDQAVVIAVGFVTALIAAIIVVRTLLTFVTRHGFAPFAYWRIVVGTVGLIALFLTAPAPSTADTGPATETPSPQATTQQAAAPSLPAPPREGPELVPAPESGSDGTMNAIVPTPSQAGQAPEAVSGTPRFDEQAFEQRFREPPQVELTRPPETAEPSATANATQSFYPPLPPRKP